MGTKSIIKILEYGICEKDGKELTDGACCCKISVKSADGFTIQKNSSMMLRHHAAVFSGIKDAGFYWSITQRG
ncbi:MAG: hypothetical protein MSB10_14010 [Clostridiales bacterium]|nr:hypothetical protein [Clostridiales bacterium]